MQQYWLLKLICNIFNSQIQKLALQMVIENIPWTP
jgi:hypothetical protein